MMLPPRQAEVFDFIVAELAGGRPFPSQREIAGRVGWSQETSAREALMALAGRGLLSKRWNGRRWVFEVAGRLSVAGFAAEAHAIAAPTAEKFDAGSGERGADGFHLCGGRRRALGVPDLEIAQRGETDAGCVGERLLSPAEQAARCATLGRADLGFSHHTRRVSDFCGCCNEFRCDLPGTVLEQFNENR